MKLSKILLRRCAKVALERRGYVVTECRSQGVVPGARLLAVKNSDVMKVAVRTSLDRALGLTRHENGRWRTVSSVDEVIVAVRSLDDDATAEVMGFDCDVLIKIFRRAVIDSDARADSYKLPTFVSLDDRRKRNSADVVPEIGGKARWRELVRITEEMLQNVARPPAANLGGFIDRVKREFAELSGVDVSKVVAEFRIVA